MAIVILKRNFFATGGRRFRKSVNQWDVRDIPDELCFAEDGKRLLPSDAVIVKGKVEAPKEEAAVTLRDLDVDRAAGDAAAEAAEQAEEDDAAAEFRAKLAAEKAGLGSRDAEAPAPVTKNRAKNKRSK